MHGSRASRTRIVFSLSKGPRRGAKEIVKTTLYCANGCGLGVSASSDSCRRFCTNVGRRGSSCVLSGGRMFHAPTMTLACDSGKLDNTDHGFRG